MRKFLFAIIFATACSHTTPFEVNPQVVSTRTAFMPSNEVHDSITSMIKCVGQTPQIRYEDIRWWTVSNLETLEGGAMGMAATPDIYIMTGWSRVVTVDVHEAAHAMFAPHDVNHTSEFWSRCLTHFCTSWFDSVTMTGGCDHLHSPNAP